MKPQESSFAESGLMPSELKPAPGGDTQDREGDATRYASIARDGYDIEQGVELIFFPVHDLLKRAVSALFCAPSFAGALFGHQAFQNLGLGELPYIDRAILLHALAFANRVTEAGYSIDVGAPVSFETLAWTKSREIYQSALRGADIAHHPRLVLKIEDVPSDISAEQITRIVSGLRPFCKHISIQLPNNRFDALSAKPIGASGLVLSLQRRAALPEILADSKWLVRMAQLQNATSCIDHVESNEALAVVKSAGIRFAVGNVFGGETLRGTALSQDIREVLEQIEQATEAHLSGID
jgi:hypothetical protein